MEASKFTAPSWLNKEFMEELLRDNEGDNSIVVTNVTVNPGVGKGENYSSCLYRVAVNMVKKGEVTEERTLVVKSLPDSEMMSKLLLEGGIMDREKRMYFDTLPALYKLGTTTPGADHISKLGTTTPDAEHISKLGTTTPDAEHISKLGTTTPGATLSPRSYRTTRPNTIVLEDLTQVGFKMADRHKGLDLQHTKLTLRAMARLHALSMGLAAQDPTSMDHYTEPFYTEEKREQNQAFTNSSIELLASIVETWSGYEILANKLREVDWVDVLNHLVKLKEGDIEVLNHGDCWTNNMLFKYNESNEVQSVKFIDFQIGRYASPAFDILYFLNTSVIEEVRDNHWDEIIQVYYESMVETLKSIGCESKIFSFEKLGKEIEDKILYGIFVGAVILPIIVADSQDAPNFDNILVDEPETGADVSEFRKLYTAPRFKKVFKGILRHYDAKGLLLNRPIPGQN